MFWNRIVLEGIIWLSTLMVRLPMQLFNPSIHAYSSAWHWKENLPSQKYVFLEGKAFLLNNFTMDGFSFQLVFFAENWKVLPSILMTSFGWKPLHNILFIANLASDRTADRWFNDVISMLSLHNHAEKSCF